MVRAREIVEDGDSCGRFSIRDGLLLHVDEAAAAYLGYTPLELLRQPFTIAFAPHERTRVLERSRRRVRGEPVPQDYEATLVTKSGETRRCRVLARLQAGVTMVELRDLSPSMQRRQRLSALARLGEALQAERADDAIFARLGGGLRQIGLASCVLRHHAAGLCVAAVFADSPGDAATGAGALPALGTILPWHPFLSRTWQEAAAFGDDAPLIMSQCVRASARARPTRDLMRADGLLRVMALRLDVEAKPWGVLAIYGSWIDEPDAPALRLLGAQVAAALNASRHFSRLARRNLEIAALDRLAALSRTAPDAGSFFADGAAYFADVFGCSEITIHLLDAENEELRLVYASHDVGPDLALIGRVALRGSPDSRMAAAAKEARPQVSRREDYAEPVQRVLERFGVGLVVTVPLLSRSTVVGVMQVGFGGREAIDAAELDLLIAMGSHFGSTIESQRLLDDLRARVSELTVLHEAAHALTNTLQLDQVLAAGARFLARSLAAPSACVLLASAEERQLRVGASFGPPTTTSGGDVPIEVPGRAPAALAFVKRRVVIVAPEQIDEELCAAAREEYAQGGRSCVALPLVVRDRALGVALIEHVTQQRYSATEIERAGTIASQLAIAIDNSRLYADLRKSYDELARAQAQLVESERLAALGELAAVVAHEVRNPLSVMFNTFGSLGRFLGPQDEAQSLLAMLIEEADRLNRIVGDMLDFARPATPSLQPEQLDRVLDEAARAALGQARGPVELKRDIDANLPLVPMDVRLLRQAMLNVAINAVQAMPAGGSLTVHACCEGVPGGPRRVHIALSDTGTGIAPEARERIFEPFFTTKASGTGLGLAVVKRIVTDHRGEIDIVSEPGVGTTINIRLPLQQESGAEAPSP
jgi:two-component system, NtrC family, sensor histidine kinase HydH